MVKRNKDLIRTIPSDMLTDEERIEAFGSLEDWCAAYIESIDNTFHDRDGTNNSVNMVDIEENLLLIEEGFFDTKRYTHLVSPYANQVTESKFNYPVEVKHYDKLTNKVMTLVGEESAKSDYIQVYNRSTQSANKKQEQVAELLTQLGEERFAVAVNKMMESKGAQPPFNVNNPKEAVIKGSDGSDLKTPEDIKQHVVMSAGDILELNGVAALKWAKDETNYKWFFVKNFIKFLCSDIICYKISKINGKPHLKVVDPRKIDFILNKDEDFIQDSIRLRELNQLHLPDIYTIYGEFLDDEDRKELTDANRNNNAIYVDTIGVNVSYRVATFEFQVVKRIGLITRWSPAGRPIKEFVHEDYKVDKTSGETIEFINVPEWWEGVRIGENVYTKLRPIPGQFERIDHIGKSFCSYVGYRGFYPYLTRAKVYQELYNAVMYLLYIALLRAKGKGMIVDLAQMPKKNGWDPEKWFYYMDFFGILPINSLERNGDKQEKSSFNQWKEYDLSNANVIQGYINLLGFLDQSIDDVFGVTPQREGQTQASETATGVQAAINKSVSVTEIFSIKNLLVNEMVCQRLVDIAQECLVEGESYEFVAPDSGQNLFTISPGFTFADFSVRAVNSIQDRRKANEVQQILKSAWAQKDTLDLLDLIKIVRADSIVQMEGVAKEARIRNDENTKEQNAQAQDQQAETIKQQAQLQQVANGLKELELQIKKYGIDKVADTTIEEAKIKAGAQVTSFRPDVDPDTDDNGILDVREKAKAESIKQSNDMSKHSDKMRMDASKHNDKMQLDMMKHQDQMAMEQKKLQQKPKPNAKK